MSAVATKIRKVVESPSISLTMMGRIVVASERAQLTIIKKSKYPPAFVPGYYELARKCVCETFAGNFGGDYDWYFDEFKRKAKEFRKASSAYPKERVMYKNFYYSAESLEGILSMADLLMPLLLKYTFRTNLSQKKNAINLNDVRVGAMADMLLEDQYGQNNIGFLKFNFSKSKYPAEEAAVKLKVLKVYYEGKNIKLNPKDCVLVDVAGRRIYNLSDVFDARKALDTATLLIRDKWDLV